MRDWIQGRTVGDWSRIGLLLLVLLAQVLPDVATASEKKGIAMGQKFDATGIKLSKLHVGWYYNWTMKPSSEASADCFVPMYWGKRGQLADLQKDMTARVPTLLVYNEPDFKNQANMSVDEVLREWPETMKIADRLSAPTAARPFDAWMRQFMVEADKRHLKMAFIPVHWYGGPDSKAFLKFIDNLYELYKRPLWITEFAVADWHSSKYKTENRFTEDDVVRFIKEVLPELERRPFVERYAWLAADTDKESLQPSLLFTDDGRLTKVGQAYSAFGPANGPGAMCGAIGR